MVQLSLVIQEVWDDIPKARITHLSPFMPRRCQVLHAAHSLSQPLLTLLHLTAHCTEQNATINFCLANGDSRQIADLTYTKQFLWAVFKIIKFPVEIDGRSLFCSVYTQIARFMGPTWGPPGSHRPQVGHVLAPWTLLSAYMRPPTWSFSVQTMTSTLFGAKILNSVVWLVACASCFLLIQRVDHITAQTAMIMMTSSNGKLKGKFGDLYTYLSMGTCYVFFCFISMAIKQSPLLTSTTSRIRLTWGNNVIFPRNWQISIDLGK